MANELEVRAGNASPLGATALPERRELLGLQPPRDRACGCGSTAARTDDEPADRGRARPTRHRTFSAGTCSSRARARAGSTPGERTGRSEPAAGLRFDAARELLDPWAKLVSDDALAARRRAARRRCAMSTRAIAPQDDLRLGRRRAARARRSATRSSTRCTWRLHAASVVGCGAPGHVSRTDREDSAPAGARRHGRRAVARHGVRPARRAARRRRARLAQLLGLQPVRVFRAASATSPPAERCAHRVPRPREGAAQRRDRRDPRRRVEPHGGGRRGRPDDQL